MNQEQQTTLLATNAETGSDLATILQATVRPACVILLCMTLCATAIIEQATNKDASFWFRVFAAGVVGEWCAERIVKRIRSNKPKE